jgi:hypothetical protein
MRTDRRLRSDRSCSRSTKDLYRSCATSPAHYFDSPLNDDLQDVFHEIGNELTNLRLAQ